MKKLRGEHVGSVAVLAQCKAAVRERRERTRREPRGGDLEDPLLIAPRRAKWPLAIQLEGQRGFRRQPATAPMPR